MRTVALLAVALLALAGCSSKSGPDNYTCHKTGRVIDLSTVEGADAKGFDPESACPAPLPPSVALTTLPAGMKAYFPALGAWTVSTGNYTMGHSMLTQMRWSRHPMAAEQLTKPDDYGTLLAQYAHQDVPAKFDAKLKFETPGTYYLRAYAQVRGDGLADTDYWSPEVTLVVGPVNATGKQTEVSHDLGPFAAGQGGKLSPTTLSAALGDAIVLVNKDVMDHTFTFSGVCKHDPLKVAMNSGRSEAIPMLVPGSCVVKSDDAAGPQQLTVNVAEPV
jgi:plastocyanin